MFKRLLCVGLVGVGLPLVGGCPCCGTASCCVESESNIDRNNFVQTADSETRVPLIIPPSSSETIETTPTDDAVVPSTEGQQEARNDR